MTERYTIPGFSKHTLIRENDGSWTVIGARGKPIAGISSSRGGRREFCLRSDTGGRTTVQVGRLVLLALTGGCPEGTECCHRDGDATNDDPSNLYWGSRSENLLDSVRHGTNKSTRLTPAQVRAIRAEWVPRGTGNPKGHRQDGAPVEGSLTFLAAKYGINFGTVGKIVRGERWPNA